MEVDSNRRKYGQYVLTGSQVFPLMKGVSESLAGRVLIFQLYPLSFNEIKTDPFELNLLSKQILKGFYPEFEVQKDLNFNFWHRSYISTYIERDLKALRSIQNLSQFQRYIILLAARCGQLLNLSEVGRECGISQTTARDWLSLLEATSIVYILQPYFNNMTKRIVKSPKIFFVDTGVLCYLLRIKSIDALIHSPFISHIFENMVIMEKIKKESQKGEGSHCYFYRTSSGTEVDLVVDNGNYLDAYEIKFTSMPKEKMTSSLKFFSKNHNVKKAILLSLLKEDIHFSNKIVAKHWSSL